MSLFFPVCAGTRPAAHPVIPAKAGVRPTTHPCHSREGGNPKTRRALIPLDYKGRLSKSRMVFGVCALGLRRFTVPIIRGPKEARRGLQSGKLRLERGDS
jgi:hypothetical protein